MAATDSRPVPRKGVAYRHYFSIRNTAGELVTTWAGQDSEVSLDGAAYADCTNEATEIGTSGTGYIDLTAAEMTADCVLLKVTITNTDAVLPVFAIYPEEAGDYRVADTQKVDVNTIKTQAVTCAAGVTIHPAVGADYKIGVASDGDITKVNALDGHTAQTGDAYAVVAHADYGNAKLVRSTTPANTLTVDAAHKVAVPDTQKVDVNTWLTATPGALTDTDKLQCSVQHIAASYDYTAAHVWYVSKAGNDSNAGHSWTAAKLTVSAAVAAATAGDTIIVGRGTFLETVNCASKNGMRITGQGYGTVIQYNSDEITLSLGSYALLEDIRVVNAGGSVAVNCESKIGCTLRRCYINGQYDGIVATGSFYLMVDDCRIIGHFDGINLTDSVGWIISDSTVVTQCTWPASAEYFRAGLMSNGDGCANNCMFIAARNDTSAGQTSAVCAYDGVYTFNDCVFVAKQSNAGGTGAVAGISGRYNTVMSGTTGSVSINGGSVVTTQSGSGAEYSLWHTSGVLSADSLQYDESKTSGTITKTVFDPASDTVILAATQGSYAPAKAGDAMTLTAAYDAAKTAASATALSEVQAHGDETWATADVSGAATAEEIWALAGAIDGKTPKQAMQYMAAMLAGLVSGAGTASETFVGLDGVTERVKFTTDADGNRTVVEYDPE